MLSVCVCTTGPEGERDTLGRPGMLGDGGAIGKPCLLDSTLPNLLEDGLLSSGVLDVATIVGVMVDPVGDSDVGWWTMDCWWS